MNITSFIESGILESYLLGQCTEAERAKVLQMAAEHPEVRVEMASIEQAFEGLAQANAVAPPIWMKGRIAQLIENESVRQHQPNVGNTAATSGRGYHLSKPIAFVLLFLGALMFLRNWQLNFENAAIKNNITALEQQSKDCQTREQGRQQLQQQIALLRDKGTKTITLGAASADMDQTLKATVYYNAAKKEANLGIENLAQLPSNQDYQLWVIVDGNPAPQPLNVFQNQNGELVALLPAAFQGKAVAFAVSQEPKGGTPNGSPTKVLLLGKVG